MLLIVSCAVFIAVGALFIPRLGIQNDEVLFASGLYEPFACRSGVRAFHHPVPLMLLSYLGATKTWFYAIWFEVWPASIASLRVPMLIGGALLATNPTCLLITLWGPILFPSAFAAAPKALWMALSRRNLAVGVPCFLTGAAPLLPFSHKACGETIRANATLSTERVQAKADILLYSLDGSLLFGWLIADTVARVTRQADGVVERSALCIISRAGRRE